MLGFFTTFALHLTNHICMNSENIYIPDPSAIEKFSSEFSSFDKDYVFSRLTKTENVANFQSQAMQMSGTTLLLCMKGEIRLEINLKPYTLQPNDLMVIGPDSVLEIKQVDWDNLDGYVFVISSEFIRDINFELNLLATMSITTSEPPLARLSPEELRLIVRYLQLIHCNTIENSDANYVRSISRSLCAATAYQLMQFFSKRIERKGQPSLSRRAAYVRDFINLVNLHHRQERGVAFYASKLFISPKYLSLIIKESTGRSAAEWIDDYVILEAKNLLRFSGKNVQQIAYELNFSNQSSFGKYFKHLTGMSPTKFQKS